MYIRSENIAYVITALYLVFALWVMFSPTVYAQQLSQKKDIQTTQIFVPLAELLYGPNNTEIITLSYRFAQVHDYQNNSNLIIHDPNFFTPSVNISHLPQGKEFEVIFDSYFLPNRQLQQTIPPVSNISVSLVKILNPLEASDLTQMLIGSPISIPYKTNETGQHKHFVIPQGIDPGDYLVDAFVSLADNKVGIMYSTRVIVDQSVH